VAWRNSSESPPFHSGLYRLEEELSMNGIIYLVGLIVVVMFILSLFGLR
jgi:hypothetical protein